MYKDMIHRNEDHISYVYMVCAAGITKLFKSWGEPMIDYLKTEFARQEVGEMVVVTIVTVPISEYHLIED